MKKEKKKTKDRKIGFGPSGSETIELDEDVYKKHKKELVKMESDLLEAISQRDAIEYHIERMVPILEAIKKDFEDASKNLEKWKTRASSLAYARDKFHKELGGGGVPFRPISSPTSRSGPSLPET